MNGARFQLSFAIREAVHIDAARRAIVREVRLANQNETFLGRLTVVIQELARNLINHAGEGELLFSQSEQAVELLAVDNGPGMANVAQCLTDHYSTAGTLGAGLGAIRRMSDHFDLFSQPGQGTVAFASLNLGLPIPAAYSVGAVCTPYPGEDVCGDGWATSGNRVLVCDGLGHGHAASQASQKARELFLSHNPTLPLNELMEQLHRALASTRGGATAIAEIQPEVGQVQFCGVGNIAGVLLAGKSRSMVSGNGTVGYKVGRIQTFSYPWDDQTLLVMASDGINTRLDLSRYPGLQSRHPAVVAGLIHRDFKRLNDDATVVVVKRERA